MMFRDTQWIKEGKVLKKRGYMLIQLPTHQLVVITMRCLRTQSFMTLCHLQVQKNYEILKEENIFYQALTKILKDYKCNIFYLGVFGQVIILLRRKTFLRLEARMYWTF